MSLEPGHGTGRDSQARCAVGAPGFWLLFLRKETTPLSTYRALGAIVTPVLRAWLLSPAAGDETRVQRGEGAGGGTAG